MDSDSLVTLHRRCCRRSRRSSTACKPPSNLRAVRLERAPLTGFKYSGGAVIIQQLALMDVVGKPFGEVAREWVLDPIGMTTSTFEQPLAPRREKQAARAHNRIGARMGAPWHIYPEQAAAGLWTTPTDLAKFAIEVQLSLLGTSNRMLSQTTVREMVTPVGVGPFAVGVPDRQRGRGMVLHARRGQLGLPMRPHRASREWLRGGNNDER